MEKYVLGPNAARKFKELMRGKGGVDRRPGSASGLAFDAEYAHPFAVQWAQSVGSQGSWIIWLPSDQLVIVNGTAIDVTEDLEPAEGYPDGWYVIDSEMLDADSGGTLYLNISYGGDEDGESGAEPSAEFTGSAEDGEAAGSTVVICVASVDSATGERKVKQLVSSVILIAKGSGGDDGEKYDCDERSISRIIGGESITGIPVKGNYFFLTGFGKFTAPGYAAPIGTYDEPSELTLDPESSEASTVAFLVRQGNSESPDSNFLGYRKVKFGTGGRSSPFNYEVSKRVDPDTHQTVTTHKLVNCKFYWNGALKSLQDFDVSGIIAGGSVYLVGTQAAPSASTPEPDWQWTIATAEGQTPSGGKVLNYKLYDFAQGKPSVDYRTTFLSLEDTTQKAKYVFKKPNGTGSVTIDTTGNSPKIVISDGTHSINLDLADIPDDCAGGNYGLHSLQYTDKNGDTQIFHGIFCSDIDLSDIKTEGKTIRSTDVRAVSTGTQITFYYTDGTQDTFIIQNGLNGRPGKDGDDGEAPEITAVKNGLVTSVFADGMLIASISDGHTPNITAQKVGRITTIYADGRAIATIEDGSSSGGDEYERKQFISGIRFEMSGGKLKAILSKTEIAVPNWDGVRYVEYEDVQTIDVCDAEEVDVVTSESYSTSSHQFTNVRKKITVMGSKNGVGQTPFTATPLSGE